MPTPSPSPGPTAPSVPPARRTHTPSSPISPKRSPRARPSPPPGLPEPDRGLCVPTRADPAGGPHTHSVTAEAAGGRGTRSGPLPGGRFPLAAPLLQLSHLPASPTPASSRPLSASALVLGLLSSASDGAQGQSSEPTGQGRGGPGRGQPGLGAAGRPVPGLRGPDPGPPPWKPTRPARCFPITSSELASKSSPAPDVRRAGRWFPDPLPEPPPTPRFCENKAAARTGGILGAPPDPGNLLRGLGSSDEVYSSSPRSKFAASGASTKVISKRVYGALDQKIILPRSPGAKETVTQQPGF